MAELSGICDTDCANWPQSAPWRAEQSADLPQTHQWGMLVQLWAGGPLSSLGCLQSNLVFLGKAGQRHRAGGRKVGLNYTT